MDFSRRRFLRGRLKPQPPPLRPPWALAEPAFLAACTRCGDCVTACPTNIVIRGDGGYPSIDFSRGDCTFCGECVSRCQPQALKRQANAAPWSLRAAIDKACLAEQNIVCRSCGDTCQAHAIRFQPRLGGASLPQVSHDACTGCGACVAVCPTQAINLITDLSVEATRRSAA